MPAISKAWVTIADTAVDPDSPLDAALMTGLRDDLVHLREWIGAGYTGGAVQDHNHDGVNSAPIDVGTNNLKNGSFEFDLSGWTSTPYTGGTIAINTANDMDGAKCLAITSTVLANGGGDVVSSGFSPVTGGQNYPFHVTVKASAANVSSRAEVIWYDDAQAQISASQIFDRANTETAATSIKAAVVAPATARYCKVKLIGGVPAAGLAVGTINFDGVSIGDPNSSRSNRQVFTASGTFTGRGMVFVRTLSGGGGGGTGGTGGFTGGGGGGGAYAEGWVNVTADVTVTVGAGGAASSAGGTSSFGASISCTGGAAGGSGSGASDGTPGAGGTASGGDVNVSGRKGGPVAVQGADSPFGSGGNALVGKTGYGSGGGGGPSPSGAGEAGANGLVIVEW